MTKVNANLSLSQNSISIRRFDKLRSSILKLVKITQWYRAQFRLRVTKAVHTTENSGADPLKTWYGSHKFSRLHGCLPQVWQKLGWGQRLEALGPHGRLWLQTPQKHGFAAISKNMIRIIYMKVSLFKSRRFMSRRILREVIYHWWTRGERSEEKKKETVWEQVFVTTKTKKNWAFDNGF